jgi:Kef-type K+ transport system membrane component KefB
MPKVRQYADLVATLAGLMWLVVFWSISISAHLGSIEPFLAAFLALGSMILVSFVHRPIRVLLRRYHVRKRRTEMWMHILALPLTLAFLIAIVIEILLTPLDGEQKMLLFNVLATAGWGVFVLTLLVKWVLHRLNRRREAGV